MIRLSNLKLEIDIPALTRIADAVEGIHPQLNAIRLTQDVIEERLLDICHQIEDLSEQELEDTTPTETGVELPY